jgi:hypothetical protein
MTGSLKDAAKELAKADVLAFGGVGLVGRILPPTEAYLRLAGALAAEPGEVRKQAEWLLRKGSAAGKAYAATLLDQIDPAAARSAWESLAGDKDELTTFQGCVMGRTTLAEYAGARTAGG